MIHPATIGRRENRVWCTRGFASPNASGRSPPSGGGTPAAEGSRRSRSRPARRPGGDLTAFASLLRTDAFEIVFDSQQRPYVKEFELALAPRNEKVHAVILRRNNSDGDFLTGCCCPFVRGEGFRLASARHVETQSVDDGSAVSHGFAFEYGGHPRLGVQAHPNARLAPRPPFTELDYAGLQKLSTARTSGRFAE